MAKTILIIEDDKDILEMMTYILLEEGFGVVSSRVSVLPAYVSALRPVLILRDNRLADSFGTKLCLQLKNDASTRHIPVVLVSAANQLAQVAAEAARMLT